MQGQRPNLLWIMCDQLRYHALSCTGDPNAHTPNLDRLAAEGVRCDGLVSQYPICSPFRAGLLTGQYNHVNGLKVQGDLLTPDHKTIAHTFRQHGYRTGWVGKWHVAGNQSIVGWQQGADFWVHPSLRGGFEKWCAFDSSNHYYKTRYTRENYKFPPPQVEGFQTDGLADLFLEHLDEIAKEDPSRPFFTAISFEAPHPGMDENDVWGHPAPPEYEAKYSAEKIALRPNVPPEHRGKAAKQLAGYYAQIENLDHNIGRILDKLDALGLRDNTVVMFFSDHGELAGSHGLVEKIYTYDESIRVPMIVRYPGEVPAGRSTPNLISGLDLFPTSCGLCGVPVPPEVQGLDLSGDLTGNVDLQRNSVLLQFFGPDRVGATNVNYRAIRTTRYTYCVATDRKYCCLFDNVVDPYQQTDLYGHPAAARIQRELHRHLKQEIIRSGEDVPEYVGAALVA
jgi:arylsulfatase A-like enzyme